MPPGDEATATLEKPAEKKGGDDTTTALQEKPNSDSLKDQKTVAKTENERVNRSTSNYLPEFALDDEKCEEEPAAGDDASAKKPAESPEPGPNKEQCEARRSERKTDSDGSYTEKCSGPEPDDNYTLHRSPEGKYSFEPAPTHPEELHGITTVERERLNAIAEEKIKDPNDLAKFKADTEKLQGREEEMQKLWTTKYEYLGYDHDKAVEMANQRTTEQIVGTYRETGRILEAEGSQPLTQDQRVTVAEDVMRQAADPTTVDQGHNGTCPLATMESRMYTRQPEEAAYMVAEIATRGEYTSKGTADEEPIHYKMDAESLQPDDEASVHPHADGTRSYASQLFQVTGENLAWQRANRRDSTDVRYVRHYDHTTVLDYSKSPPADVDDGFYNNEIVNISNHITGVNEAPFVIQRKGEGPDSVQNTDSPDDMKERLQQMKANGDLPAVVMVNTNHAPFRQDQGVDYGDGGWHVVTVRDIDDEGNLSVDNQWGSGNDHVADGKKLKCEDLYYATADEPFWMDMYRESKKSKAA